ncbi:PRC-barrel domain-containing protein [Caballeronia jiangsuensis]|uniref:PRC-barrel domain-containing protein n=1 Tax=Caballeronia jiangsuensis TaxID=1458357 RepID=A0ABW9CYY3_9BURK
MAASDLLNTTVLSSDGQKVGKVSHIVVDVQSSCIAYAVLSSGGFFGIGETLQALPWNVLTFNKSQKCFRVHATAARVKGEPGFDKNHWPVMADAAWGVSLHKYYERPPYWLSVSGPSAGVKGTENE